MALATSTGLQPKLIPDPLWADRELASSLAQVLPTLTTRLEWQQAIGIVDSANQLVSALAARLQIGEAQVVRATVTQYLRSGSESVGERHYGGAMSGDDWDAFRLAAAERATLSFISFWVGLGQALHNIASNPLASSFDAAVSSVIGPYGARAPHDLLTLLEEIANGIAFEERTEGRRVTPEWWVNHMAGRTLSTMVVEFVRDFVQQARTELIEPLLQTDSDDLDLTATRIFGSLELTHKIEYHLKTAQGALESLARLRHIPTNDQLWPKADFSYDIPRHLRDQLHVKLGEIAPKLSHERHDASHPDLFGEGYRRLFDATFHAIIESQDDLAQVLFPAVVATADQARARLVSDLANERAQQQLLFGSEPLMDLMELSGYALLMSELDATGTWRKVKALWDQILATQVAPALALQMTLALTAHQSLFALTSGGIGRTERRMALSNLVGQRDLGDLTRPAKNGGVVNQPSAIVATFLPRGVLGIHYELADLFIVEYLLSRPNMPYVTIPRSAEILRDELDRRRKTEATGGDHGGEEL